MDENKKAQIIRWETPFTNTFLPSVNVIIGSDEDGGPDLFLIVAPKGLDQYPKHLVRFRHWIAHTCHEEAYSPSLGIEKCTFEDRKACAHLWLNSPSLESYRGGEGFIFEEGEQLQHFLLIGGDHNVEVISTENPDITEIKEPKTIHLEYQL